MSLGNCAMKKPTLLSLFIIISSLSLPAVVHSAFIIHLKNGGRFQTPRYWEENHELRFFVTGGVMGIGKDTVSKIEHFTDDVGEFYEVKTPKKQPAETDSKPSISRTLKPDAPQIVKEEDPGKDPHVLQEFNRLETRFASRTGMTLDELAGLKRDLTALRETIVSSYPEEDYRKEIGRIADMRFFTNDLILRKSKGR
jgi:hypothetical protein